MKITAYFENCRTAPDMIDVKDLNGKIQSIKWEDDSATIKEDCMVIDDACFLSGASDNYEEETEYIYDNIRAFINDFENDISYTKLIFEDGAGVLEAVLKDSEENPMEKEAEYIAHWAKDKDEAEAEEKETRSAPEVKAAPDSEAVPDGEADIYNNQLIMDGKVYPSLKEVESLSQSVTAEEIMEQLKVRQKELEKELQKEKEAEKAASRGDEMEL